MSRGLPISLVLAFAAALELLLQALRAFFPLGYHLVGSLGFVVTPLVLLAVFLAPLAYLLVPARLRLRAPLGLAAALAGARIVLQVQPSLGVAIGTVALGLLALTSLLPLAAGHRLGPDVVAAGTLVGLGLDVALRAWRATDDVVWTSGPSAWIDPSLLGPILLLVVTLPALRPGAQGAGLSASPTWTWHVLLMPSMLLWTSLAFVGSSSGAALAVVTMVLLLGVAVAMAVLAWPRARLPWPASAAVVLGVAVAMPQSAGWPVLVLAVAATVATPLLLREAAARAALGPFSAARHAAASTAGAVAMFTLLLLYPLHYEIPLPLGNAWLPALAVVLACLPLLGRPRAVVSREFATPSRVHRPALVLVSAGAVVLGAMVHLQMVGGSPAPGPDPALSVAAGPGGEVRVATYNTGQGQDAASGRLAFRAVARAILDLDADVVALQEVPRGWPLTSMSDLDAWLRAHTDLELRYAPAADDQLGNALASRVTLADVRVLDLGQGGGAQQRSAISATLPGGHLVYGTHLQARNTEAAEQTRLDQMRILVEDWAGRPATVIAGDLNPRNDYADASKTPPKVISNLEVLLDAGLVTTQPTRLCTLPTSNDNCSDYVFTSPDVDVVAPTSVVDLDVSDHRPVLARLAPAG